MNSANASSAGGWSLGNPVAQGASTIYEGSKNVIINGADYVKKGAATITPSASNVAKTLGKGVAGVALSVAVEQLIGAVDWVLDPANNRVNYYPSDIPAGETATGLIWKPANYNLTFSTPESACRYNLNKVGYSSYPLKVVKNDSTMYYCYYTYNSGNSIGGGFGIYSAGVAPPKTEEQRKSISLDAVAAQVISNAEGNTDKKAAAQVATGAAAADIVAEAETDSTKARPISQQLEASASIKPADEAVAAQANTATGESVANPETGASDLKIDFPVFCNWSPSVCEAAQVVISFPQTLTDWWEAAKEWATSEPQEKEPENLDFEDLEIEASDVNLSASSTCPQDSVSFSVMGKSVTLDMPYQPVCDALNFFKPAVLLVGSVASVYIVAGVRTKEEDQP